MRKRTTNAVGQLTFTFFLKEEKDDARETQGYASPASGKAVPARNETERKRKWNSLIDKVYALPNLWEAWLKVKENDGAAGIDRISVRRFDDDPLTHIKRLAEDLRDKTYRPQPVRRVLIPKSGGGERPLGIPTVRDRIVQQALLQVLEPIFETTFSDRSHGFRPDRGTATANGIIDKAIRHGYTHVVDADIQAFFDNVDHELVLDALNEEVADGSLLKLVRLILKAGVVIPDGGETEPTELGAPQGGPLSPLLANVYLTRFDEAIARAGYGLVRYADDFVVFARSEEAARDALEVARQALGEVRLTLHPEKTRVASVDAGFEFLGFHYFRHEKTGVRHKEVRPKSAARFREAIRKRTPRSIGQRKSKAKHITVARLKRNGRVQEMIRAVNAYLRGWHWYFKAVECRYDPPFETFDGYVRARLRSAILGRLAKASWHPLMTNRFMSDIGYVSLKSLHTRYLANTLSPPVRKD